MKKLFTLIVVLCYCLIGFADNPSNSWVISNDSKIDAKKVNFKDTRTILLLENGKKITIPNDQIQSYSSNGKVFKKLPLYVDGKITNQLVFMELVKNQDDMQLYKYNISSYSPNQKTVGFLLFKDDQMVFEYDEKSHRCPVNANP